MDLLTGLNSQQQKAIAASDGPVLVLAGPGSGKTRVLTHRVAWLVQELDVAPWRIMAVTFTNRAAREMRERLEGLLGSSRARSLTLGTFHATCARILRREFEAAGISRDYAIFDADDQRRLIKQALKDLNLDDKRYRPQAVHAAISRAKNELIPPEAYTSGSYYGEVVKRIYERYQALLAANGGLDFDDLLMVTVQMFAQNSDVLSKYRERYRHILVDEFQDTNQAQYTLLQQLSGRHHNLFCVADEDQCLLPGTLVETERGAIAIEDIRPGEKVWAAAGQGTKELAKVVKVHHQYYKGQIVEIETRCEHVLRATPNHIIFARLGLRDDVHYVYLLYHVDKGYRIGMTVGSYRRGAGSHKAAQGLRARASKERADLAWVLGVYPSVKEAGHFRDLWAAQYGLPITTYHKGRDFPDPTSQREQVERLFADHHIFAAYPHYRPQAIVSGGLSHRATIYLVMFGTGGKKRPCYHVLRFQLRDPDLRRQLEAHGYRARDLEPQRTVWSKVKRLLERTMRGTVPPGVIHVTSKDYDYLHDLAQELAQAGGGVNIVECAYLTARLPHQGQRPRYDFQPAAHLYLSMFVAVEKEDRIVEDQVVDVRWYEYEGEVYDLEVADLHNYIANGIVVHNSIYRWRGADYRNIRRLRDDHPDLVTVLLEQNYRSTQTILDAAHAVIRHNPDRTDKSLFTQRGRGPKIAVHEAYDQDEEARFVVDTVARLGREGIRPGDCAVMYRTNAQSRAFEDAFIRAGMPYRLVWATRFYARREIRDVIAFLRLVHNPTEGVSMARVINVPPRGIGRKTVAALEAAARERGVSIYEVIESIPDSKTTSPRLGARAQRVLTVFLDLVDGWVAAREHKTVAQLIDRVLQDVRYTGYLRDGTEEGEDRWANVLELRNVAAEYADLTLTDFLADVALVSDVDSLSSSEVDALTLLTLHSAKGLEFPVVFITGLEEGILPHSRSFDEAEQMAEERRLMYVGLTRAEDRLFLTYAFMRTRYGESEASVPSRFLEDVPSELVSGSWRRGQEAGGRKQEARGGTGGEGRSSQFIVRNLQFRAGQRVRHATFGEGLVIESRIDGSDEMVTVHFERVGLKRLMASYARLERLGE